MHPGPPAVSRVPLTCLALACALSLGAPAASSAARLFSPARAGAAPAGAGDVQTLVLDRRGLAELRGRSRAVVPAFPLGRRRSALVLDRFSPFSPGVRIDVVGRDGGRRLAPPDTVYFAGTVAGEPGSRVFVAAGRDRVHGLVVSGGDVYLFGPDGRGGHRTYALRDADPTVHRPPNAFCYNDLHPEAVAVPAAERDALAGMPPPPAGAPGTVKAADVAIDTDRELRAKFASDAEALDYLASLVAATSAIYERDLGVRLRLSYVRLWGARSTDPWNAAGTKNALYELRQYWTDPANRMAEIAGPRALVHLVSGRKVHGGIAYLHGLCSASYGYGVSQVYGSFDLSTPSQVWDVLVFAHEIGHTFGSPHSHCYSPPLDRCWGQERGCYAGPAVTSRGTIMSYCHLRSGGLSNVDLLFGGVVSARIADSVGAAACLGAVAVSTTSTTSTTLPAGDGEDLDGVPDGADACPGTPRGDLVDATGCSVCPCEGPRDGGTWRSHAEYLRCLRDAIRRGVVPGALAETRRRVARARARTSTCGRRARTRCCVYTPALPDGRCRIMLENACAARVAASDAVDLGPGSCVPSPCAR